MKKQISVLLVCLLIVSVMSGCGVTDLLPTGNPTAVTIGSHELSTVDLTYFYVDAINRYQSDVYNQYYGSFGNYWSLMLGFDTTKPLNEQQYDTTTGKTWADYFMDTAIDTAKDTYALYDAAMAAGYQLTDSEQSGLDSYLDSLDVYATYYGYSNANTYLRESYCKGATEESYKAYYTICTIATSYLNHYSDYLEYTYEDYRAFEKNHMDDYSTLTFSYCTLEMRNYYSVQGMNADVEKILNAGILDKNDFDTVLSAMGKDPSTEVKRAYISSISLPDDVLQWLKDPSRKYGDMHAIKIEGSYYAEDVYYIVLFTERDNQDYRMVNVRHILVKFEGGTKDSDGNTTYSDEEKAAAKAEAEQLLQYWKDGKANEDSFAELANKESDDNNGKVTNGGLYEDIYKGQMVEAFEEWCFAEGRQAGNTGLVETEYGWHVMYFSSYDEMSYRDALVEYDLRIDTTESYLQNLRDKLVCSTGDLSKMPYDYTIDGNEDTTVGELLPIVIN